MCEPYLHLNSDKQNYDIYETEIQTADSDDIMELYFLKNYW